MKPEWSQKQPLLSAGRENLKFYGWITTMMFVPQGVWFC